MIKKLKNKLSLIILLSIAIPLLFITVFFGYSYYENTIRSTTMMLERFDHGPKNNIDFSNFEGVYVFKIVDSKIINSEADEKISSYATKVIENKSDEGIVGDFIYRKRNDMKKGIEIILVESKDTINKIKIVLISLAFSFIAIMGLAYLLAKYISKLIVKPVEETFEQQKNFISDASHELKTPLAVIQANADVLEDEIGDNKWLKYIQNETDNMGKLINELLLLTKIENVDMLRTPEEFNLSDHIELITSTFESMAFEKKVKLETDIEKNIVSNKFNRDDITHILSTLIDNGIKHTSKNKKVTVELKKQKDKLIISVKNEGEEIHVSEREKIFDRFYRIDKSRNRSEKRYGLGLAICKATVLKNDGTIIVECNDGVTLFKVELPN